jgi:hypothetical protein
LPDNVGEVAGEVIERNFGVADALAANTEVTPFSPMYGGLAVCTHDDATETTALFSDVTVEVLQPSGPTSNKK